MPTRDELYRLGNDLLHLPDDIHSLMLTWDDVGRIVSDFRDFDYMIPTWDDLLVLVTPLSRANFRAI
jgi:hypothetical protein